MKRITLEMPDNAKALILLKNSMTKEQFKGYLKGNVIKYITRFEYKNGVEDIEKAMWYLNRLKDELN